MLLVLVKNGIFKEGVSGSISLHTPSLYKCEPTPQKAKELVKNWVSYSCLKFGAQILYNCTSARSWEKNSNCFIIICKDNQVNLVANLLDTSRFFSRLFAESTYPLLPAMWAWLRARWLSWSCFWHWPTSLPLFTNGVQTTKWWGSAYWDEQNGKFSCVSLC